MVKVFVFGVISGFLLHLNSFQVVSPVRTLQVDARVSELIDHQNGTSNSELVRQIFFKHEADSILATPLTPSFPHDSRIWAYTAFGRFSVASAYRIALQAKIKRNGDCRGSSNPR